MEVEFFKRDWFYTNFAADYPSYKNSHINCLELLTVLEATKRWAPTWGGLHIRVLSDNSSTVCAINKGSSHSPEFMGILRTLFWLSVKYDFRLSAEHIKGEHNVITDMISRLHMPAMCEKFVKWMNPVNLCIDCTCNMSYDSFLHLQGGGQALI